MKRLTREQLRESEALGSEVALLRVYRRGTHELQCYYLEDLEEIFAILRKTHPNVPLKFFDRGYWVAASHRPDQCEGSEPVELMLVFWDPKKRGKNKPRTLYSKSRAESLMCTGRCPEGCRCESDDVGGCQCASEDIIV